MTQLTSLERRTARGGRDSIDHAPGAHDDVANAVAGALVTAYKEPGVANFRNAIVFPKVGLRDGVKQPLCRECPKGKVPLQLSALCSYRKGARSLSRPMVSSHNYLAYNRKV